nr:MAG TPA: hypothetical protein [Caudoviricetes sp.]
MSFTRFHFSNLFITAKPFTLLSSQTSLSLCLLFSGNFRFKRVSFVA